MTYWYMLMLAKIFGAHDEGHTTSIQLYMMQWSLDNALRISIGLQIEWIPPSNSPKDNIPKYTREHYNDSIIYEWLCCNNIVWIKSFNCPL